MLSKAPHKLKLNDTEFIMKWFMRILIISLSIMGIIACGGQHSSSADTGKSISLNIDFESDGAESRNREQIHLLQMVLTPSDPTLTSITQNITSALTGGETTVTGLQDYIKYYVRVFGYDVGMNLIYVGNDNLEIQPGSNALDVFCHLHSGTEYNDSFPQLTACATTRFNNQILHLAVDDADILSAEAYDSTYSGSLSIKSMDSDNGNVIAFPGIQSLFDDGLHLDVSANDNMWVKAFDVISPITVAGDTFDFSIVFTNVFGQADIVRTSTALEHVFDDFPTVTTASTTVSSTAPFRVEWTLPFNQGSNIFSQIQLRYQNMDMSVDRLVILGPGETFYDIPAADLIAGQSYELAVSVQAGGCDLGESDVFIFNVG